MCLICHVLLPGWWRQCGCCAVCPPAGQITPRCYMRSMTLVARLQRFGAHPLPGVVPVEGRVRDSRRVTFHINRRYCICYVCTTCCAQGTNAKSAIAWAAQPQACVQFGEPVSLVKTCMSASLFVCRLMIVSLEPLAPGTLMVGTVSGSVRHPPTQQGAR